MKNLLLLSFISIFALSLAFGQDNKTPYLEKSFDAKGINKLTINTSGGSINVSARNNNNATVKVFVSNNNGNKQLSMQEIEERLKDYQIKVFVENGVLICTANKKTQNDWNKSLYISFDVKVNQQTETNLKTSGGSISLSSLSGKQVFSTSGGSLNLEQLSGDINGATFGGSISLNNGKGNINLKTSGGSITTDNVDGKIDLNTSGGSMSMNNIKGDVVANTSGGSINIENLKGSIKTRTSGGSITLNKIMGNVDAETSGGGIEANIIKLGDHLKLRTSAGNIRVDIPLGEGIDLNLRGTRIKSEKLKQVASSADLMKGKLKGKINGGGVDVNISTSAGTIFID